MVAKGSDIAYFGTLAAFSLYVMFAGTRSTQILIENVRNLYAGAIRSAAHDDTITTKSIEQIYLPAISLLAGLGFLIFVTIIVLQIIQIRGIIFTTHPLKPDFNRINPAKGLKRLFSFHMLKEAFKNLLKLTVYVTAAYLVVITAIVRFAPTLFNADQLLLAMNVSAQRLLFAFVLLSLFFAVIDQVIARQEFRKQMRMSKSEVKREHKDREGEPRIKQKRQQLHKEFAKQTQDMGNLPGSDLLIVNPTHFAVALKYDPDQMSAPEISTKGRNRFAMLLRQRANNLGIPVIHHPALARELYQKGSAGLVIPEGTFRDVAKVYLFIRTRN